MENLGFDISPIPAGTLEIPRNTMDSPGLWNPRMVFDVALGIEDAEIIAARYDLTKEEFNYLIAQPSFRKELAVYVSTFKEHGVSFGVKAKLIAEEMLDDMFKIIRDQHIEARVRADTWWKVVQAAGLASKESEGSGRGGIHAGQVNIQINY